METLTLDYLKSNLKYNSDTGIFTWGLPGRKRVVGKEAGTTLPNGYRSILLNGKRYYSHRLAWFYSFEEWPENGIDHINRDKLDNRLDNLRDVTQTLNMRNRTNKNNSTGVTGVYSTVSGKFKSQLLHNSKYVYLGTFNTIEEASYAYSKYKQDNNI